MHLTIMAEYQSQECLVIPILVIPKENKITDLKMVFTHGGKNTMVCLTCNTPPAHLCAQEKEEQLQE